LVLRRLCLLRHHRSARRPRRRAPSASVLRGSHRVPGSARLPHVLAESPRPEPARVLPGQLSRAMRLRPGHAVAPLRPGRNPALGIAAAVNAPFAILARSNWRWFFEYNSGRDNEPSLYTLFGAGKRDAVPLAGGVLAASVIVCLFVFALSRRRLRIRAAIAAVA